MCSVTPGACSTKRLSIAVQPAFHFRTTIVNTRRPALAGTYTKCKIDRLADFSNMRSAARSLAAHYSLVLVATPFTAFCKTFMLSEANALVYSVTVLA
jgi:hypothetical protein